MPKLSNIADIVTATLPTFEKGKWDAVGLAQLYPEYEFVRQFVQGAKVKRDTSYLIDTSLEIAAPSSFEAVSAGDPLTPSAHKLVRRIQTPMVKCRTSMVFLKDEKDLQGASPSKILEVVKVRMTKFQRDFIEGAEHQLLQFPASADEDPDTLRGLLGYWITPNSAVTSFSLNGGSDPVGHSGGAGGLTKAQESRWPNAVAKFAQVTPSDYFDLLEQFLNQVNIMPVVPNPSVAKDIPRRINYVQEPVKRAASRYMQSQNDNHGNNAGIYRNAVMYGDIPITIWHAMSSASSPVRPSTATALVVDWNAIEYRVHSAWDQAVTGPEMSIQIPGQLTTVSETYHAIHSPRRDRHMYMTTDNTDLTPA